ncbi:MAG TPA: VIT domain-containing protein [Gemmatimonadaceae bacterium]|nr:VIT domain-containing protein [Gemmatimonadaceae bacterium]
MFRSFRRLLNALLMPVLVLSPAHAAQSQGDEPHVIPCPRIPCGPDRACPAIACVRPTAAQVVRTSSSVRADLDGRVVRYEVTETYTNRGGMVGEADYMLPLPKGAAFEQLALSINGEMVTGETMDAGHARGVYEEIVRKLRDPALVEWMGHGLLRARIFPIQPGEEKRVVVRFSAVAEREGDALRLDWLGDRRAGDATANDSFTLSYPDDATLGDVYSPTNALHVAHEEHRRVARIDDAHGPVTMLVPVRSRSTAAISLLANAPNGEDGFALITLTPPARPARATPRDIVLVIDVSGSMSGRKIEQARAAGRQLLQTLTPSDRFRLIDFSSDVRTFRDGWAPATPANVSDATAYLDALRANGGTNIQGALDEAFASNTPEGRLPLVLFLTDGAPTVGETRPDAIVQHAGDLRRQRRLFTFGIGADVNASLLEQLALQGGGTATFVRPEESVERAVGVVAERLTRPVATDVHIHADGVRLHGLEPEGALDLFAGQDLVVLARYTGAREGATLVIDGTTSEGPVRWTGRVSFPAHETGNAFVPRLWAAQRVGYLSAERRRNGANPELDAELRQLGERYGIPTELTSYLVTEHGALSATGPMPAPLVRRDAASMQPGAGAANAPALQFEAAKAASEQRAATSLGALDKDVLRDAGQSVRLAGNRTFTLQDSVWTEARPLDGRPVVKVKAFSPAYFALVQNVPELAPLFAVGERVRVLGRHVAIEMAPDGLSELDAAALAAVVKNW